jgi:hypothetical protein
MIKFLRNIGVPIFIGMAVAIVMEGSPFWAIVTTAGVCGGVYCLIKDYVIYKVNVKNNLERK